MIPNTQLVPGSDVAAMRTTIVFRGCLGALFVAMIVPIGMLLMEHSESIAAGTCFIQQELIVASLGLSCVRL